MRPCEPIVRGLKSFSFLAQEEQRKREEEERVKKEAERKKQEEEEKAKKVKLASFHQLLPLPRLDIHYVINLYLRPTSRKRSFLEKCFARLSVTFCVTSAEGVFVTSHIFFARQINHGSFQAEAEAAAPPEGEKKPEEAAEVKEERKEENMETDEKKVLTVFKPRARRLAKVAYLSHHALIVIIIVIIVDTI